MRNKQSFVILLVVILLAVALCGCTFWTLNNPFDADVTHAATVTILAGSKGISGSVDGTGALAQFNYPREICSDGANLYVLDDSAIRKIVAATGVVTTVCLGAFDGSICTDGTTLFLSNSYSNCIYEVPLATGVPSIYAGSSTPGTTDGTGTAARFNGPAGICTDGSKLYVADKGNNSIRQIDIASAVVTTIAGSTSGQSGTTDGIGNSALFSGPFNVFLVGNNLVVCQSTYSYELRIILLSTMSVSTQSLLGSGQSITGSAYDGNQFVYGVGDGEIGKIDTSSWYGLAANMTGYSASSLCVAGSDVFITDSANDVVLKLVSIE